MFHILPFEIQEQVMLFTSFKYCIKLGYTNSAKKLYNPKTHSWKWAASKGYLEIIKFLHENNLTDKSTKTCMNYAATYNRIKIVKYLHLTGYSCTDAAMDSAAILGNTDIVKFLYKNRKEGNIANVIEISSKIGCIKIIKLLYKNVSKETLQNAMYHAIKNGNTNIAEFFLKNIDKNLYIKNYNITDMYYAIEKGHYGIVKFLHKNCCNNYTKYSLSMELAARYGHFKIVKFLHENEYSCTESAIDLAAENGHLKVVKFLHYNGYSCTDYAIESCSENGHLEVVKFLYLIGKKYPVNTKFVSYGQLEVLKFLTQ